MYEWLTQHGGDLASRLASLMTLRLMLLPALGVLFAIRDGIKDARDGRPAFIWTLLTNASLRRGWLTDGWTALFRIVVLGMTLDAAYQFIVLDAIHPVSMLASAVMLALLPYFSLRGVVDRMARRVFQAAPRNAHVGR
jgi:hypothetical protein